ncbi:hypothetical protein [Rhizobium sp. R693]|uniref:hypothetical protein n=1 Tax=Rhizobium sp. R693 TaxID=1764276 RepID=UPI000B532C65|nr:hypothetical protein [Rhizobium sp. R693]OWV91020.1 hypothetical protein ATY79_06410 [Rhizobium sp. R693]
MNLQENTHPALSIPLVAVKSQRLVGHLDYQRTALANTQRRLVGRYALAPVISFAQFTTSAVIDWMQLSFVFARKTQFQWVQKEAAAVLNRLPHVEPTNEQPGGVSDRFDVRIQEPDIETLLEVCRKLDEKFTLSETVLIGAIEISVDFTPKTPDEVLRAKLFTALTRHFVTGRDVIMNLRDRPRFAFGRGPKATRSVIYSRIGVPDRINEHFLVSDDRDRAPFVDSNYYVGAKEAAARWRIMDKVIDTQNIAAGTADRLEEQKKRVRIEVTLDQPELVALGVHSLGDLERLNFSRLQGRYFRFMLPTFEDATRMGPGRRAAIAMWQDRQRTAKFSNAGVIGLKTMDDMLARRFREVRKKARLDLKARGLNLRPIPRVAGGQWGTLVAYDELNDRVTVALRHLGERAAAGFSAYIVGKGKQQVESC